MDLAALQHEIEPVPQEDYASAFSTVFAYLSHMAGRVPAYTRVLLPVESHNISDIYYHLPG